MNIEDYFKTNFGLEVKMSMFLSDSWVINFGIQHNRTSINWMLYPHEVNKERIFKIGEHFLKQIKEKP